VGVFLEGGGGAVLDFAYQKKKTIFLRMQVSGAEISKP
jgi:hypothetical protein